jgi:hypothetical protein
LGADVADELAIAAIWLARACDDKPLAEALADFLRDVVAFSLDQPADKKVVVAVAFASWETAQVLGSR